MNILRLKDILQEKDMTGKELADMVEVSQNTISSISNGNSFPKPELLVKIASALDVDVRELLISTKEKDLTDPSQALLEIKGIIDRSIDM